MRLALSVPSADLNFKYAIALILSKSNVCIRRVLSKVPNFQKFVEQIGSKASKLRHRKWKGLLLTVSTTTILSDMQVKLTSFGLC